MLGDVKETTKGTDFVLKELSKRLNQLQLHVLQQSTDVMMGLDGSTGALERDTFDNVGVQGTLEQPLDFALGLTALLGKLFFSSSLKLGSLGLKDLNEGVTDDLSLTLGVLDTFKTGKEEFGSVNNGEVNAEINGKHLMNLLGLVFPEHTVVDHDSVESNSESDMTDMGKGTHRSPMASCINLAATVESTPPLTAPIT